MSLFLLWVPPFMSGGGPKKSIFDQKWQAYQRSIVVQNGPKWSIKVFFLNLGPFWAHLDPFDHFRQKMIFCSEAEVKVP